MTRQRLTTRLRAAASSGALLTAAMLATPSHAVTVTTADGNGADSYVRLGQAGTNFGAASGVVIKDSGTSSTTRLGYLRFDLSGTAGVFDDATLTLDVSTNNTSGGQPPQAFTVNVYGLADGDSGENWGEGTINWSNAPANNTSNNQVGSGSVLLGSFSVPAVNPPTSVDFNSKALANFLNQDTDGNATIILQREGGPGGANLAFASKENGGQPAPTLTANEIDGVNIVIGTEDGDGADSYVRLGEPSTNYGGATSVLTKDSGGSGTTRKGYLRFDLSEVTNDALEAALILDIAINNAGGGSTTPLEFDVEVFGLLDGDAGEGWDESTIDWDNAPANGANNGILGNAQSLGVFRVEDNSAGQVLFTSQALIDFINADTDNRGTLILRRISGTGSNNLGFGSKENDVLVQPTLSVIMAIPEPATASMFGLAIGGLALRRRRRAN